jgi:hypothetical protein
MGLNEFGECQRELTMYRNHEGCWLAALHAATDSVLRRLSCP